MIQLMIFGLVYLVALIFQWSMVPFLAIGDVTPNIPFLCLVFWAWHHTRRQSILAGFFTGLLADFLGGGFWGQQALVQSVSGYLAGTVHPNRFSFRLMVVFLLVFFLAVVHELLNTLISCWHNLTLLPNLVLRYAIPSAFFTALIGIIFQFIIGRKLKGRNRI